MPHQDDDDADQGDPGDPGDQWVIGTWHVCYHVQLLCVIRREGKPCPGWHPSSALHDWYRWASYHAARKFQRAHAELAGYVVCNLSALSGNATGSAKPGPPPAQQR